MLGSQAQTSQPSVQPTAPRVQAQTQVVSQQQQNDNAANGTLWAIVGLIVAYVLWAVIEQHQKVKDAVKPTNIAFNLRNMFMILFTVILGQNILKVLLVKLAAWKVPFAKTMLHVVGGA